MDTLSKRLKKARKDKGLSQQDLADLLNVKQQAVSKLESGRSKGTYIAPRIAEALGVNVSWLLTGKEDLATNVTDDQSSELERLFKSITREQREAVVLLLRSMKK